MAKQKVDGDALQADIDIVDVISSFLPLRREGSEYIGICKFHDDTAASLSVNPRKQIFKCFACGAGGDALEFLQLSGKTFKEAVAYIKGESVDSTGNLVRFEAKKAKEKAVVWKVLTPNAEDCSKVSFKHYIHGEPSKVWAFRNAGGSVIGYSCRFDFGNGKKDVIPLTFCTNGKRNEWRWQGFETPRPIYGLDRLAARPEATVVIVEGEKTADCVQEQTPTGVVIAWPGGSRAIEHIDWQPLKNRKIIFWPDNDQPGESAMLHVYERVKDFIALARWVWNEKGLPKGWDGADKDWTALECKNYILGNSHDLPEPMAEIPAFVVDKKRKVLAAWQHEPREGEAVHYSIMYEGEKGVEWRYMKQPETEPKAEPEPLPEPPPKPEKTQAEPPSKIEDNGGIEQSFFKFLGFSKGDGNSIHNFFKFGTSTIISLSPSGMTKNNLIQLAPLQFWEQEFPSKTGMSVDSAANWLTQISYSKGIFSDKYIRGRGAWIDGKSVIIHAGDELIVDGQIKPPGALKSKYIYETGEPLGFATQNPLTNKEAIRLMDVMKWLNWEREINSYLLAGWCVVAPICGALNWRPHLWLTGGAGTGKSWLLKQVVRKLLGETVIAVQGETSEAGLRQILQHDALPVVFDEAEGETRAAQDRMQSVLGLMRAASADDGGIMAKGTANGAAKTYRIRSCFAFGSIAVQVAQQSDRTRVTVLGLREIPKNDPKRAERWTNLQAAYLEVLTDEFVKRLQARTVKLIPVILENARVFAAAAAIEIGEQRAGDQLGALLAGAYSLSSSEKITLEKALAWLKTKDWSEEKGHDATKDELSLLGYILEQIVMVESAGGLKLERNIGELVAIAAEQTTEAIIGEYEANARLKRAGMKVEGGFLLVSNTADWIRTKLSNTAWAKNHNKILLRLQGAEPEATTRFGSKISTRAVKIPLNLIFGNPDELT